MLVKRVIAGAVRGAVYYAVFLVLLPELFSRVLGAPVEVPAGLGVATLGLFVALSTASSVTKPFIGIPLDAVATLLAVYILLSIGGEASTGSVDVSVSIAPLLGVVAGFTVLNTVIAFFEKLVAQED